MSNPNTSTALTIVADFRAMRVSKAGKESYRGALGVITSGTSDERAKLATTIIEGAWANNAYRPIVAELSRAFAPLFKVNKAFGMSFAAACGLDVDNPKKVGMLAFFRAVVKGDHEKPLTGEKATYCTAMKRVLAYEDALSIELAAQAEAAGPLPVIDATAV